MRNKTWKRETAVMCLLYLFYLGLFGRLEVVETLAWPVFLFAGAAYGMDWADKSTIVRKTP
jgi:hypothetical protein